MLRKILCLFVLLILPLHLAAQEKMPIIIGLDADVTAVAKAGGVAIQRGAQIAIDEINQAGGVLGRELSLEVKDHRGNPRRGVVNIESFAKNPQVVAVLGGVHTPVALSELPAIHENKLIYLGPWAAGTPIVENGYQPNYVFRVSIRDNQAGQVLMGAAKSRGFKKVGLLLERTGWGVSNEKSMTAAAKTFGLSIVSTQWFNWREQDMSSQVDGLIDAGAQVVMLVANAPEGVAIARYMASLEASKRLPVLSHWGVSGGEFVSELGLDLLQKLDISVIQTYSFLNPSNAAKNQAVIQQYRKKFDTSVTAKSLPAPVGVAHAYDLVHMLALAISEAGSIDREQVRNELEKLPEYQGLVKHYKAPFLNGHDALLAPDYQMTVFDEAGHLIPVSKP